MKKILRLLSVILCFMILCGCSKSDESVRANNIRNDRQKIDKVKEIDETPYFEKYDISLSGQKIFSHYMSLNPADGDNIDYSDIVFDNLNYSVTKNLQTKSETQGYSDIIFEITLSYDLLLDKNGETLNGGHQYYKYLYDITDYYTGNIIDDNICYDDIEYNDISEIEYNGKTIDIEYYRYVTTDYSNCEIVSKGTLFHVLTTDYYEFTIPSDYDGLVLVDYDFSNVDLEQYDEDIENLEDDEFYSKYSNIMTGIRLGNHK